VVRVVRISDWVLQKVITKMTLSKGWEWSSVVEHLLSMLETLGLISATITHTHIHTNTYRNRI
jgi:hypothetical protein